MSTRPLHPRSGPGGFSFYLSSVLSLCSLCLCGESSFAGSPALGGGTPRGAQRGKEVVLSLSGARLSDAEEVLFYSPGFKTTKLKVVNPNVVQATVQIASDCLPGEHALRLRTKSGISELR